MQLDTFESLINHLEEFREGIIAIDGLHGVGKSTLASKISNRLGLRCLHLDDFLVRHQGAFLDHLRYDELSSALVKRPVVVEGVCLLAALQRLAVSSNALVYVKSTWRPDQSIVALTPSNEARHGLRSVDHLSVEVDLYHKTFKPIEKADIIYNAAWEGDMVGRADIDIAFIQAKTKLAIALSIGGMLALAIGLVVLLYGVTGNDQTLFKSGALELSASGLGAVIMSTSVLWAFFAYKCRPIYAQRHDVSERYGPDTKLLERA